MDGVQTNGQAEPMRESAIRRRRKWSAREKAQIVQEAQRAGAVLQEAAQRHGLHPTLLKRWCRQHDVVAKKAFVREARLLPVRIEPRTGARARVAPADCVRESPARLGTIEVELSAGRRLHLHGVVDAQTLRTVLQELSRP